VTPKTKSLISFFFFFFFFSSLYPLRLCALYVNPFPPIASRQRLLAREPPQCHNPHAMARTFHVYLMASKSGILYLGVTGHFTQRVFQHKGKLIPGFTRKYNVTKVVWIEPHPTARAAISHEKEIKRWNRSKKVDLIESLNPTWGDLTNKIWPALPTIAPLKFRAPFPPDRQLRPPSFH
jgi:putative endonuclease